jgi:DNA uptake protein ComE-like DNA-binding protein
MSIPSLTKLALLFMASLLIATACGQPSDVNTATNSPSVATSPVASSKAPETSTHSPGKPRININDAILSELDRVEAKLGIAGLSNQIQAGRPYAKIEDLVAKKVITQAQFEQVKDMVSIETVALTGEAKDIDYMLKLGLMKGHMLVAKELIDLKQPKQAEPHIGHPVEEIYADVEDQLKERNVKDFKDTLIKLQDLVKSKPNDPAVATTFSESVEAIDLAIAVLPEAQRQSPNFTLQVINGLLDTAGTEYTAAIADNKVKEIIEYQDSRGFVIYAEQLYKAIEPQMQKQHPEEHAKFSASMVKLKTNWPSAIAPATPVLTPAQVSELIKGNETVATKVYAKS